MFLECYLDKKVKIKTIHKRHFTKRSACLHQMLAVITSWEGDCLGEGANGEGRHIFYSMFFICLISNLKIQMQS